MNQKLLIFDIDGTICDINRAIDESLKQTLEQISIKHKIVLSSGKPCGYITGFIRQVGLKDAIVVGENGASIMYSSTFPPESFYQIDIDKSIEELFIEIKQRAKERFKNDIWFQPNDINLTIFPIDIENIGKIHSFAKEFEKNDINIYYHSDSVDFTPKGFDKGTSVDILLKELNIKKSDLYIFGDGSNDLPMLLKSENSYLIGRDSLDSFIPKRSFKNYSELNIFLKGEFLN